MVMTYQLTGEIDGEGELRVRLPDGFTPGEVRVIVTVEAPTNPQGDTVETPNHPRLGAEIAAFLRSDEWNPSPWEDVSDPVAWLERQRQAAKADRWSRGS